MDSSSGDSSDSSSSAIEWSDDEFDMIINTKLHFYFLTMSLVVHSLLSLSSLVFSDN